MTPPANSKPDTTSKPNTQKRVFITGGASGLGRALAERYSRAGWRVCIGDTHDERGRETAAALGCVFRRCDVRSETDLPEMAAWLRETWGGVDVVVNNAGVVAAGGIAEIPMADWAWSVEVNLLGVVRGCRAFTPIFRQQGRGHFVNISSLAGLVHLPRLSPYTATKAAVVALSESLHLELGPEGIGVSVVCPSFFRTRLMETARSADVSVLAAGRQRVEGARGDAESVAERIFRGVARGEFLILPHPGYALSWWFKRLTPFRLYAWACGRALKRELGEDARS